MDNVLNLLKDRPCDYCVNHQHGYCTVWSCPFDGAVVHEKQNEGHYEYGVIDGKGDCLVCGIRTQEAADIKCGLFNIKYSMHARVAKRLVMAWEPVEEE